MTPGEATRTFNDDELTALLHGMHDRRDEVARDGSWSITGQWRSFMADFVKAEASSATVAVKFGDGWSSRDARFVSSEVERVGQIFDALPAGSVTVPRSLGWSEEPAAIVLPFVEGNPLFDVIRNLDHPLWDNDAEALLRVAAQCGQAIGAYHSSEPASDDAGAARHAFDDLQSAARRAGVRRATIGRVEPSCVRARGYRFSHNDLIVTAEGNLVMLDPPHLRKYDYLPRDLSAFTFQLHRALVGDRPVRRSEPNHKAMQDLRKAFLDGYATTGPSSPVEGLDAWLLRVFEIARVTGLAYARLRRGAVGSALRVAAWAAQLRRDLDAPPTAAAKMGR